MKLIQYILVAFLIFETWNCQAADTLKINLTYKHQLNSNGQSTGFKTVRQQFHTPDGVFFREVNYDDSTGQLSNYIFIFYKNGKVYTEECHNQNTELVYIIKHEYDAAGNEILREKLVPSENLSLITTEKTIRTYSPNHKITACKYYSGKKLSGNSKYIYNDAGLLVNEKSTYKPSANTDVKLEQKVYSHDQEGRISVISVTGKNMSGKAFSYQEEYLYKDGLLSSVKRTNGDGTPSGEKVYKYLQSGIPSLYEEHDATGRLTLLLQYDYKKHFMEVGTQKSYYEGL